MYISLTNTIGAIRTAVGIVRKNLQLWLDFEKSEVIGSELVVNGGFDTDSDWVKTNANISNGYFEMLVDGGGTASVKETILTVGNSYTLEFEILEYASGLVGVSSAVSGTGFYPNAIGVFTYNFVAANTILSIVGTEIGFKVDNISVKEVTQFAKDKSPNTNNAKLFTGKALSFNGNDYVDIDGFTMSGDVATFAFWINPSTTVGKVLDFSDSTSTDNRLAIGFFSNTLKLYSGAVGSYNLIEFGDLTLNTYSRVVIAINGTSVSCYVNNSQLGSTGTIEGIDLSTIDGAAIGSAYYGSADFITAELSDVQIYNKAWTAEDIAFDYNNPNLLAIDNPATSLIVTDLKAYWALSEGDGLVAYDSGSTLEEDLIQNGDFSELGVDIVTNGGFATDSDWNYNPNWSINTVLGVAESDGTSSNNINQGNVMTVGLTYEISFEIISLTSGGGYQVRAGSGSAYSSPVNTLGVHRVIQTATTNGHLYLNANQLAVGSVDNISVKQVDPNDDWTLGTGWSYGDDRAVAVSGSGAHMTQNIGAESGKQYQVNFDIEVAEGKAYLYGGQYAPTWETITESNSYSFNVTWGNNNPISFYKDSDFVGSITNISVKEITQSAHGSNITPTSGDLIGATYVDKQPTIPQLGMMDWAKGSNLLKYSEEFDNAVWGGADIIVTEVFGDLPPNISRAFKVEDNGANAHLAQLNVAATNKSKGIWAKTTSGTGEVSLNRTNSYGVVTVTNEWQFFENSISDGSNVHFYAVDFRHASTTLTEVLIAGAHMDVTENVGNYILTDGAAAIDVTTIQNPNNKGYDVLGNPLRLREHGFNLDGTGYGEVADDDSLDVTGDISICAWVNPSDFSNFNTIVGKDYTSAYHLSLDITTGSLNFWAGNFNSKSVTSVSLNTWTYVSVVRVGTIVKYYINASHLSGEDDTNTGVILSNSTNVRIGAGYEGSGIDYEFSGILDEPLIYNRALTLKEIKQNFKAGINKHKATSSFSDDFSSDYGL